LRAIAAYDGLTLDLETLIAYAGGGGACC